MTIADMLGQSGVLTLLGMGIVFSFLVILIIAISMVGKTIRALGAGRDVNAPARAGGTKASGTAGNGAVTAAISAAVNEYRKDK